MVRLTKTERIHTYLAGNPYAKQQEVFNAVNRTCKEKDKITLNYCRKIAHLWRKENPQHFQSRQKLKENSPTHDDPKLAIVTSPQELDSELLNILKIMKIFTANGVRVQFREIFEFLQKQGITTGTEKELQQKLKFMDTETLVSLIKPRKKLQKELVEEEFDSMIGT